MRTLFGRERNGSAVIAGKIGAAVALCVGLVASATQAAPTQFTGTLTDFQPSGLNTFDPIIVATAAGTASYSSSAFTLPASIFNANEFASGTAPLPTPFTIYLIGVVVNSTNGAGNFAAGTGPQGGFGGTMAGAGFARALIGLSGLPVSPPAGTVSVPIARTGTATAAAQILPNAVTVIQRGESWTTGTVFRTDMGFPSQTVPTAFTASGTNQLGPNGGTITLVAPYMVEVLGARFSYRVGYKQLQLTFVPEPNAMMLVGTIAIGLALAMARRRNP